MKHYCQPLTLFLNSLYQLYFYPTDFNQIQNLSSLKILNMIGNQILALLVALILF